MTSINIRDYLHTISKKINSCQDFLLTQDQKDEILEAFTLYDKDGDGLICTKELGKVIRALGHAPTVCEETDIVAQFAQENCNDVDYLAFVKLITSRFKVHDDHDDKLRESFRKFDLEDKGVVDLDDIRTMLTTIGEPLTQAEVDEWLQDGEDFITDKDIHYEDFATFMLSK